MTFFYTQFLHIIITLNWTWPFSVVHFKQNFERPYVFQVSQKYLQPKEVSSQMLIRTECWQEDATYDNTKEP